MDRRAVVGRAVPAGPPQRWRADEGPERYRPRVPAAGRPSADGGARATGRRPDPGRPRPSGASRRAVLARRLRIAVTVASALVLVVTGTAWGLYRDLTAGITTTDVITGGADGGPQDILLVGVDSRTDARGEPLPDDVLRMLSAGPDTGVLNSDTVILLHVPDGGGAASAFSVPRDSYVDIPGLRRDKINAAYPVTAALRAEELVAEGVTDRARIDAESAEAGRRALIGAVERLTGVTVDHYAEINLLGFHDLTRAIGGVDVCLRAAVDEPLSGARLPAGPQTISGTDALAFVRQRHGLPEGDLSRIRRQQVFLAAVADKILSGGVLTDPGRLGALVDVAERTLVIDEGWDVLGFAQRAKDIAAGNVEFLTVPTRGRETNERGDVVLVDPREVAGFVEERVAAQEEAAEAARDAEPPPPATLPVVADRYVVDVRNASDVSGLATRVATRMRELDFGWGTVDNTDPADESTVRHAGPDREAAEAVAEQLGGIAVERDDTVARGHLLVVLGADFDAAVLPAPAPDPPPSAAAEDTITAAGVPCVD